MLRFRKWLSLQEDSMTGVGGYGNMPDPLDNSLNRPQSIKGNPKTEEPEVPDSVLARRKFGIKRPRIPPAPNSPYRPSQN